MAEGPVVCSSPKGPFWRGAWGSLCTSPPGRRRGGVNMELLVAAELNILHLRLLSPPHTLGRLPGSCVMGTASHL